MGWIDGSTNKHRWVSYILYLVVVVLHVLNQGCVIIVCGLIGSWWGWAVR